MKKLMAWILVLTMLMGMSVTAFAADTPLGSDDFYTEVDGSYKVVTKRVEGRKETFRVTGYSFSGQAKDVFRLMNMEREAAGVPKLTWEEDLVQPAIQRALEQYVEKSHTRPNGKDGLTVSSLANGENLAGGDIDAYDVMDGWMNSRGHKSNILDPDFTSVAVACVDTDQMCFWVQLFHADKKVKAGSSSSEASATSDSDSKSGITAKSIVAELEKAKTSAQKTSVTVKNQSSISAAALKAMADWGVANKKTVSLSVNTAGAGGKGTQGQITLAPADFAGAKNDINLGVRIDDKSVLDVREKFENWYQGNNFAIIKLDQTGNFGASVKIAAKAELTALDDKNLVFYRYDPSSKKISKLPIGKDGYSIDKNKYLRFTTSKGGYIVVTDQSLTQN